MPEGVPNSTLLRVSIRTNRPIMGTIGPLGIYFDNNHYGLECYDIHNV